MEKPELSSFPVSPGVYLYKDKDGRIIYVGKARRLRQRIASYFQDSKALPVKTITMLRHAESIDILQTGTEKEALLLEASLIKKHRPRYNILLRDDKEYLLFRISSSHPYPRVEIVRNNTRNRKRTGDRHFGPFSSGTAARETYKLILKNFPLRRCKDVMFKNRTRPCLYHDMGQCLGPCVLNVEPHVYKNLLHKVELFLSGRSRELVDALRQEMHAASDALDFEQAARIRDQIRAVERTLERQSVVLSSNASLDIIGVSQIPEGLALGILFVRDGLLLDGRNFFWPGLEVEDTPELLWSFMSQFYLAEHNAPPPRIIVPWLPDKNLAVPQSLEVLNSLVETRSEGSKDALGQSSLDTGLVESSGLQGAAEIGTVENDQESFATMLEELSTAMGERRGGPVHIGKPRNKDEDHLAVLAADNARETASKKKHQPVSHILGSKLQSAKPLERVEVVDISHTSGEQTRAGMVVFMHEQPVPEDFRNYALDEDLRCAGAEAGDDYAALGIWASRRVTAGPPWADLVLIDGGKGQLQAVASVFAREGVLDKFTLASIAKARDDDGLADRRKGNVADRIFLPGRSNPVNLAAGSPELLFLQRVRDAAHDFVLGRHRQARSAASFEGELTRLPGIGPALARSLFDSFSTLENMAKAGEDQLAKVPGIGKARARMLAKRLAVLVKT